ncbi:MAG: hypothetical protein M3R38_11290 [Actinomycetota bacterium]|nr:hypothetical protein [Actinomycetota bacterium]
MVVAGGASDRGGPDLVGELGFGGAILVVAGIEVVVLLVGIGEVFLVLAVIGAVATRAWAPGRPSKEG